MEEIKRPNYELFIINTLKAGRHIKIEIKRRKKIYQMANMTPKKLGNYLNTQQNRI